ncbi:citrate/tricarballylate utilization protein [Rhodoblastus acidophilus]|uniref:tricarballylate utilization 4Fe-4S protein TcuB n=1 Tax=Rhodoblastus acidophilus TaxID=1074 RepID=UPI002225729B|nr:citrate/tricarballylate utilization protein [Rhodoblastus acidophilus]
MPLSDPSETERILNICAACMYCDGLCPVFPALTGRDDDIAHLANLCHNCRACWYACQYAPPHPFAVNAPAALSRARRQTYADHVWPRILRHGFVRPWLGAGGMLAATLLTFVALVVAGAPLAPGSGAFYAVIPWGWMAGLATGALVWAALSLVVSTLRYWRAIAAGPKPVPLGAALRRALGDIVTLRHLDGGGPGCHETQPFSRRRKWFHQAMAGGVMLAFAATLVAAGFEHFFGAQPPFPPASWPVLLGLFGGAGIVVGAAGLLVGEARMDRAPADAGESQLNVSFLIALELVAVSGLALLALRDTPAMGPLLLAHLSLVTGFFVGLPASKAIHAPFRAAALLRAARNEKPKTRSPAEL